MWITNRAGRSCPRVIFASPVRHPPSVRHSSSSFGPAAPQQRRVRRVHDRIDLEPGDVPLDDFDPVRDGAHRTILPRPPQSLPYRPKPRHDNAWVSPPHYLTCSIPTASAPAAAAKIPISTTCDNVDTKTSRIETSDEGGYSATTRPRPWPRDCPTSCRAPHVHRPSDINLFWGFPKHPGSGQAE